MNALNRRRLLDCGIGFNAVVMVTGFAMLAGGDPLIACACFIGAVGFSVWTRGLVAGVAATLASLLMMRFVSNVDVRSMIVFTLAATAICAAFEFIRRHTPRSDDTELLPQEPILRWLSLGALPLLALIIYTNVSDVAMRNLPVPSLLQPVIFILAAAVWHYRKPLGAGAIITQPLALALAAYCFVQFCSTIWAPDVRLADERVFDTLKNLAMFVIAASLAVSWRALHRVIIALTVAASALSLVTMAQTLTHDDSHELFGFARIQVAHLYAGTFEVRPAGPVGDPNFYAQFLLMIVPLALFAAFAEQRPRVRTILFAGSAIIAAGTVLTYSRGAMLALALMTALAMPVLKLRIKHIAPLAIAALIGIALLPAEVTRRMLTIESIVPGTSMEIDSSIIKRKLLLGTALRMFDDHLVGGVGAGNFTRYFQRYANETGSAAPQYDEPGSRQFPHTLYLEIGAETGLLGLATFGAAIALAYLALLRARRVLLARGDAAHAGLAAGLAIALTGYLITSLFLHGAFQRYLWLLFALIAAAARLTTHADEVRDEQ
ncbi:MAG TPA: O-antigen ligase family protein, partial [Thermoanaerobaculia bacterium]